ncbi:Fic family protein [Fibrella forsythiae]|uniref:Fic family protein n=1 Tax=Fibrella forsythiae TaxID=2817061 RepID=A0ABS3JHD6_9BACT|nr:Fic family protein [Fibrella forsythiae]MBO0949418.1 Fic family protein [Fibrella forsythiae]
MAYDPSLPYNDLPDLPPAIDFHSPTINRVLTQASRYLGELSGLCASLPDPTILINTLVLQESRDSSAIENIVTTQDELYRAIADEDGQNAAAKEVLSYREALYVGLDHMNAQHKLLTTNTFVEVVQTLKKNRAGIRNTPGTALKNANSGSVVYTPPCCEDVLRQKLAALEQFINEEDSPDKPDPLIKLALLHHQFEAIHPFLDGNGRTGRILMALYLVQQDLLPQPVLYLSRYINSYKQDYYRLLRQVTEQDAWAEWIVFILTGISETARLTASKIRRMLQLMADMEGPVRQALGSRYDYSILQLMFTLPYLKIELLERRGFMARQTATTYLKLLAQGGVLTATKTGRTTYYVNQRLIDLLAD